MKKSETVAARIGQMLKDLGARRCFGVIGTANFKVTHALATAGVDYIAARHEGNAAAMADAYAKATGELTLLSVHSGPGLTNALTGIGEAAKSRTPLLVLAGDTPVGGVTSNFHFDQAEMARSVGAVAERVHAPHTALNDVMRAVTRAMRDRQTVILSLPIDIADAAIPEDVVPPKASPLVEPVSPAATAIQRLVDDIINAKRPLLLAGRGAVLSDAEATLIALGDRIGAVLATTVCGYGLFNQSPWSVGVCGGFSSQSAVKLIEQSDLVIGFGATFTQWTTRKGRLIGADTVVAQIDIDPTRLGSQRHLRHAVSSDAKAAAAAILQELANRQFSPKRTWRSEQLSKEIELGGHHNETYEDCSTEIFIDAIEGWDAALRIIPKFAMAQANRGYGLKHYGGLLDDNERRTIEKVPLLGDIPGIGELFRSRAKSRTKTNLMVFIRPTIIRSAADAQALAARRYGYVRNQQWAQRQDREPSIDELVRDYLGTGAPVAPASAAKSQAKPEVVVPQMRESQQRIYTAPVPPSDAKK